MNIDELLYKAHISRRIGKTTIAITLVKAIEGILIVNNEIQAKKIRKEHGIQCIGLRSLGKIRGTKNPIIIDQDASIELIGILYSESRKLEEQLVDLEETSGIQQRILTKYRSALISISEFKLGIFNRLKLKSILAIAKRTLN